MYTFDARAELQELVKENGGKMSELKSLRAMLYALLHQDSLDHRGRETDRTLSLLQVGDILDEMASDPDAIAALSKAVEDAVDLATTPEAERPTQATPTLQP